MNSESEQGLLRVHLSNFVKFHRGALYEALVEKGRRERLAGATVLTGIAGYLGKGPLLGQHPFAVQVERPVVVEFVDRMEALDRFLDQIEPMLAGQPAIVTLERAQVRYGGREAAR